MERRSNVSGQRRRKLNKKKLIGRTFLLFIIVMIGIGIYKGGQLLLGTNSHIQSEQSPQVSHVITDVAPSMSGNQDLPKQNNDNRKVAYLTFDDGPNKYTDDILDVLSANNVKATFFMLGDKVMANRDIVKRMSEEGHYPALHSMSHDYNKLYKSGGSSNFIDEFTEAQRFVEEVTGIKPTLIRAPYGSSPQINETFRGDIAEAGFKMWDWTIDSLDWKYASNPPSIVQEITGALAEQTEVILMHDRKQTADQLQNIIDELKAQGYEFEAYDPNNHFVSNFYKDERL
ncbi:polysaccharide deacetylase family protein [Paenibacillus sp. 481]|uniref:polysaccharide deacetylase family protein n=1 Tax=Paenibacillus sp. 481 TaxID=2835869 RepID=UPI001E2FF601|nr:polysaccharide deacetylase family protein [Paenibacillus sp. 481]UHA73295.1 polysaccharide deacetylase [Paenibacillus sp. 481]